MSKDNLFVRMWRAISGAEENEARIANNTPEVRAVMLEALGEEEFQKLLPVADPLNPGKLWKPGTDPALWGDVLLLASRGSAASKDTTQHLEAFHEAGGKFCNLPDKDGIRPIEYIFNDAYQAYANHYSSRSDKAARLVALIDIGVTFDQKDLRRLKLVTPEKEEVRGARFARYYVSVPDPEHAFYARLKVNPEVLDQLREDMTKIEPKSNVIPFAKSG